MSGSSRRTWLVARREWNQRVRTAAFRISTVVSVLIVVLLIAVPQILGGPRSETVGLVGERTPQLPAFIRAAGQQLDLEVRTRAFVDQSAGLAALRSGNVSVLLVDQGHLVWKAGVDEQLRAIVTSSVGAVRQREAVAELGLTPPQAQRLLRPPGLGSTSLAPVSSEQAARGDMGRIAVVLLFMAIAFYCSFVLVGVVEEKSSRVVEVLLSRLRPTELLAGKVVGIGLVGLAQFGVVAGAALIALAVSNNSVIPATTPSTMVWIVFWFVLAYSFYSVLYATAGSLVSRQEETQSMSLPLAGALFVAYILAFAAVEAPNGGAAIVGSLFPPTAPMVMIVRIAHGGVPWLQIALSIALMAASIFGMILVAGRIYAGAVMRIGPRMGIREAWHAAAAG
jgi:ABC-2 type transport system permease protein